MKRSTTIIPTQRRSMAATMPKVQAESACPVDYPNLVLFLSLSDMMSLAAPAFVPMRLRAPVDEVV